MDIKLIINQKFVSLTGKLLIALITLIIALSITWFFTTRPWEAHISIGDQDSAFLGTGFYTKEVSIDNIPFRWTNGPAVINIPWLRSAYLVSIRADTATGEPYFFEFRDRERRIALVEAQPGFRTYRVLWPASFTSNWYEGLGVRRIIIYAQERSIPPDKRLLGVAVSSIHFHEVDGYNISPAPFILVSLTVVSLTGLLWPLCGKQLPLYLATAMATPTLYGILVWHPPVVDHTWLPLVWLPELLTFMLVGMCFIRYSRQCRQKAVVVAGIVFLAGMALLITLQSYWIVEGPDYGWHLNHGGSWERVFRAHPYYPFGFPLVLWLGQLVGDQALLFGRTFGTVSVLLTIGAIIVLAWRLCGYSWAWYAVLLSLGSPVLIAHGVLASTDAPMVAFTTASLLALCWSPQITVRQVIIAGFLLGCAYLFRFQSIILLPVTMLWLVLQPPPDPTTHFFRLRYGARLINPGVFLFAFVLASAPQWILDIRDVGYPFFNTQYTNIWLFAYGRTEPLPVGSNLEQLWFLVNHDPAILWQHWMQNVFQFSTDVIHRLFIWPISLLALCGVMLAVVQNADKRYGLMLVWMGVYVAAVALTANKERFFMPIIPIMIVCVLSFLSQMYYRFQKDGIWAGRFASVILIVLKVWIILHLALAEAELAGYGSMKW